MTWIVIDLHTFACIRPNNSLYVSLFPVMGVLIILPNKQVSYDS